ncbi:hypothetical protein D3C71_34690 [compost metagenome]
MRIFILILTVYSSILYSQEFTPSFDFKKFVDDGGVSKEIYTLKNDKLEVSEKYLYFEDQKKIILTTNTVQSDGRTIKEVAYTLDSKNRISKEEIKSFDTNGLNDSITSEILTHNYYDFGKTITFNDKFGKIFIKKYFFYKDEKTLVESLTISSYDLIIQERSLYYKDAIYDVSESQTFTSPRYKTITKTKLDKNGFPENVIVEGEMVTMGKEKIPKQIFNYKNELDSKGNLCRVYEIKDSNKKLVKKINTVYK